MKIAPQLNSKDIHLSAAASLVLENGRTAHLAVTLRKVIIEVFSKKVWEKTEVTSISHILGTF